MAPATLKERSTYLTRSLGGSSKGCRLSSRWAMLSVSMHGALNECSQSKDVALWLGVALRIIASMWKQAVYVPASPILQWHSSM
eukprot:5550716-Amphidinium_carterae.1